MNESTITEADKRFFHRNGFLIKENALAPEEIGVLRREADCLLNFLMSENVDIMKDLGGIIEPIPCGYIDPPDSQMYILSKKAYTNIRNRITEEPDTVVPVLFGKIPALARPLFPPETRDNPLCLFNEQYIIKSPKTSSTSSFAWHQDSQYMDPSAQKTFPIISCWVALDDVTISNGTLLIEPFPKVSTGDPSFAALAENPLDNIESYLQYFQHLASCYGPEMDRDKAMAEVKAQKLTRGLEGTRHGNLIEMEKQEYHNDVPQGEGAGEGSRGICRDPYVLVEAPAGSIVFLSGFVRHCSFGNASSTFRRVFMPQYSIGKVESEDGGLISLAVPCSDHLHG